MHMFLPANATLGLWRFVTLFISPPPPLPSSLCSSVRIYVSASLVPCTCRAFELFDVRGDFVTHRLVPLVRHRHFIEAPIRIASAPILPTYLSPFVARG